MWLSALTSSLEWRRLWCLGGALPPSKGEALPLHCPSSIFSNDYISVSISKGALEKEVNNKWPGVWWLEYCAGIPQFNSSLSETGCLVSQVRALATELWGWEGGGTLLSPASFLMLSLSLVALGFGWFSFWAFDLSQYGLIVHDQLFLLQMIPNGLCINCSSNFPSTKVRITGLQFSRSSSLTFIRRHYVNPFPVFWYLICFPWLDKYNCLGL